MDVIGLLLLIGFLLLVLKKNKYHKGRYVRPRRKPPIDWNDDSWGW